MADQVTKLYVDGNMHEMTREEYIKVHGFDPAPVMEAVNNWRMKQVRNWVISQGGSEKDLSDWILETDCADARNIKHKAAARTKDSVSRAQN